MQGMTYAVDLVLVIDLTGSMGPILEQVKSNALGLHDDIRAALAEKDKEIDRLRVRIVGFRDYFVDGSDSMMESRFFELPEEGSEFASTVAALRPTGGGDEPESGLEALALAIRSQWTEAGTRQRQIIAVWTDASAHSLEKAAGLAIPGYPSELPSNFNELTDDWEGQSFMSATGKRLIMFAPDAAGWSDISANWENAIHFPSKGGQGLRDVDYAAILDTIANSV